jgi:single-strand DNA-binding protein
MAESSIVLVGNLTRDPELKFLNSGLATVKFSLAVNRKFKDNRGEEKEQTSYFDCSALGSIAENIATSLKKGERAIVQGRLEQRTWDTPEGEKRSAVEVKVEACGADLRFAVTSTSRIPNQASPKRAVLHEEDVF